MVCSSSESVTPYFDTPELQEEYQKGMRKVTFIGVGLVVGVILTIVSTILALIPLFNAPSGIIQYDLDTIVSVSVTAGLGILFILASLQRRYADKRDSTESYRQSVQNFNQGMANYDARVAFHDEIRAGSIDWEQEYTGNFQEDWLSSFVFQAQERWEQGNLDQRWFDRIKYHPQKEQALNKSKRWLDPNFTALFQT
jgi:hypothetical protein